MPLPKIDIAQVKGELARRSLKEFIKLFWHVTEPRNPFIDGWVIDCFCEHLESVSRREIRNLLIAVPPNFAKSLIFSVFFPAWQLVQDPSSKLLYASYTLKLSERDSLRTRRLLESELFKKCYPDVVLDAEKNTRILFHTTAAGYRQATSSSGSVALGLKGNFCVVDDLHRATDTKFQLEQSINWWVDSFYNRLADFNRDCRIVVGQRIAKTDIHAHIMEHYPDSFTAITLPYEYRPTTFVSPIGWSDPRTDEGAALWPERFPESEIAQLKKKPRTWFAQWQQDPTDSEYQIFKEQSFQYWSEKGDNYILGETTWSKKDVVRLVSVDLAISTRRAADYTVIIVADVTMQGDVVLLHMVRERIPGTRIIPQLIAVNDSWKPAYFVIEDVAFQRIVIDQARQEGLAVRGQVPQGDKEARSIPLQVRMESGQIWFPLNKKWVATAQEELMSFPGGRYDDVCDALSMLAGEVQRRGFRKRESVEGKKKTASQLYWEAVWADSD